ncbi:hypothetical protein NHX12_027778 [Muraenolepis orangiensis]|uniref:Uncharacterized protein n=1 Tax=Muraenolepis orangiensis TaxID=630683 RepID=A0A9Q0EE96_9TELE|nr:hypothetical protein NHX12_027778 [Muraenolepis orangiensis]
MYPPSTCDFPTCTRHLMSFPKSCCGDENRTWNTLSNSQNELRFFKPSSLCQDGLGRVTRYTNRCMKRQNAVCQRFVPKHNRPAVWQPSCLEQVDYSSEGTKGFLATRLFEMRDVLHNPENGEPAAI